MPAHDASARGVAVLAFHSISAAPGPTSIDAATFRMQMDVLAEHGFGTMTCDEFLDWRKSGVGPASHRVLLTFDDGFADFETAAYPILREREFTAIAFVPTGKLGQREDWRGADALGRRLMSWSTVRELARAGVEFGGHGVTHSDLTRLSAEERRREIECSAQDLAEHTGRRARSFAPPYGRVDLAVLADISRCYDVAFGTRFARAQRSSHSFDVPRIEMHYFREEWQWRAFVRGGSSYYLARRALRAVRQLATRAVGH
jgi:peptidoglycan/xylan/chitin deacetylase (PgdA/CDA1 family)